MRNETIKITTEGSIKVKRTIEHSIPSTFTQTYDPICNMLAQIKYLNSIKLMYWLLAHATVDDNTTICDSANMRKFNLFLKESNLNQIAYPMYLVYLKDLKDCGILNSPMKGSYSFNPVVLWRGDRSSRKKLIREGEIIYHNPVETTLKVEEPMTPYDEV